MDRLCLTNDHVPWLDGFHDIMMRADLITAVVMLLTAAPKIQLMDQLYHKPFGILVVYCKLSKCITQRKILFYLCEVIALILTFFPEAI